MRVKIADFGLARETLDSLMDITACGTPQFIAPELRASIAGARPLPFKPDIYSLGVMACYMATKQFYDTVEIHYRRITFPTDYTSGLVDFIYFMMVRLPQDRPRIA